MPRHSYQAGAVLRTSSVHGTPPEFTPPNTLSLLPPDSHPTVHPISSMPLVDPSTTPTHLLPNASNMSRRIYYVLHLSLSPPDIEDDPLLDFSCTATLLLDWRGTRRILLIIPLGSRSCPFLRSKSRTILRWVIIDTIARNRLLASDLRTSNISMDVHGTGS